MKNTNHTPGPWSYSNPVSKTGKHLIVTENAEIVAEIKPSPELLANAKLIAAAPLMLSEHFSDMELLQTALTCIAEKKYSIAISHLECIMESKNIVIKNATS